METIPEYEARVLASPARPDLIEGIIPTGPQYSILAGRPGLGKSILGLQMAFCVATGTNFLGLRVQQGRVGYIGYEGTQHKTLERINKIKTAFPDVGTNLKLEPDPLHYKLPKRQNDLINIMQDMDLLIIDPLKYFVIGDYTKPLFAQAAIGTLIVALQKTNTACVIIHHVRKRDPRTRVDPDDLSEVKGAGDYVEGATSVILMEQIRQGHAEDGTFSPASKDIMRLYFPKTRDAIADVLPMTIQLNRTHLIFEREGLC